MGIKGKKSKDFMQIRAERKRKKNQEKTFRMSSQWGKRTTERVAIQKPSKEITSNGGSDYPDQMLMVASITWVLDQWIHEQLIKSSFSVVRWKSGKSEFRREQEARNYSRKYRQHFHVPGGLPLKLQWLWSEWF